MLKKLLTELFISLLSACIIFAQQRLDAPLMLRFSAVREDILQEELVELFSTLAILCRFLLNKFVKYSAETVLQDGFIAQNISHVVCD